ncbi:hypothetical protein M3Y97_00246800 [Aphelenchoides bicaudatus]|nr:hypothetical protein M3Y97_00246800 [Aphelenchoides bicaudatus]
MSGDSRFIITVDIGTTTIRTCLYDQNCSLRFYKEKPVSLIYETNDDKLYVEMDPDVLFSDFKELVCESISNLPNINQLAGMGICCQRNTIISWDKLTLKPFHRFLTWKDCRAIDECRSWNESLRIKLLNVAGRIAYFFTRSERYKAAGFYKFLNAMVPIKFLTTLKSDVDMQQALDENRLQLATLDAWLISRLTLGRCCFTEPSNASSTGLFDPFLFDWGYTILKFIGFPLKVLPELRYSGGQELCRVDKSIFGVEIPLLSLLADSQAAAFGSACTQENMFKFSIGTGTFVNLYSDKPYSGLNANDTATAIKWALSLSLCDQIEETSSFTNKDAQQGLCFVPAFGGVQTPCEDNNACAGFLGLRPNTTKRQMMFAVIESVSFKIRQIWDAFADQQLCPSQPIIRLCGGVSKNDFICQQISNLIGHPVERVVEPEFCSAKGTALLAGVTAGLWSLDDCSKSTQIDRRFEPKANEELTSRYNLWLKANSRCLEFY